MDEGKPWKTVLEGPGTTAVWHISEFLPLATASALFDQLEVEIPWSVKTDDFGRQNKQTHYQADPWHPFSYVGLYNAPEAWHPRVAALRDEINRDVSVRVAKILGGLVD